MPEGDYPTRNISSRRRYERLPLEKCSVDVYRYIFFGMKEKCMPWKAVGVDLSEVGMKIALPERMNVGEKLRLVANLDQFKDVIEGECAVVWCAANARVEGEFLAGIEWTTLADGCFSKIQQIRKTMRSKEYQQMIQTKERMKKAADDKDGTEELEYKPPPSY